MWPCTYPNREKIKKNFFFLTNFFNTGSGTSRRTTRTVICTSTASGAMILCRRKHGGSSRGHVCTGRFNCRTRSFFMCRSSLASYILSLGKRRCHLSWFQNGRTRFLSLLLDAGGLQRPLHLQYTRFCALQLRLLLLRGDFFLVCLPHRPLPLLEHVDCGATPCHRTHTLVHGLPPLVHGLIFVQHGALHAALHAVPMHFVLQTYHDFFLSRCAQRDFFFLRDNRAVHSAIFFFSGIIALCTARF